MKKKKGSTPPRRSQPAVQQSGMSQKELAARTQKIKMQFQDMMQPIDVPLSEQQLAAIEKGLLDLLQHLDTVSNTLAHTILYLKCFDQNHRERLAKPGTGLRLQQQLHQRESEIRQAIPFLMLTKIELQHALPAVDAFWKQHERGMGLSISTLTSEETAAYFPDIVFNSQN
ncbi:MAG: hypothetical protein ACTHMC_17670 [Pseudobacter sp.]|uniref:hypothetical protein n=1 Tax=Pseudobacter sp. TaxID=2045420 RepID=UPI003F8050C5